MSKKPGDWWDKPLNIVLDRLKEPIKRRIPTRYFVCNTSDLFHEDVPSSFIIPLKDCVRSNPRHTFVTCTKRPERWLDHHVHISQLAGPLPPNWWFLVTIENQARFDERWPRLAKVGAQVRGLHMEPLLGPVDISPALQHVQWVVVGGANGPGARPMHPAWVMNIRDQCVKAGVPFWFKGWGRWLPWGQGQPKGYLNWGCLDRNGNFTEKATTWNGSQYDPRLLDGREWNELPGSKV